MSVLTNIKPSVNFGFARLLVSALASAVLAIGVSLSSAQPMDKVQMVTAGAEDIELFPAFLARELGFYKEEGVDVQLIRVKGASLAITALYSGDAELAIGSGDHTILQAAKGKSLQSVILLNKYLGIALVVAPKWTDKINSVEDLKGKTVGVTSPGGGSDLALKYYLSKKGIAPEEVPTVGIGIGGPSIAAMEQGEIAAGILFDPAITELRLRHPTMRVLADFRSADVANLFEGTGYPGTMLYGTREWIEKNPAVAEKVVKAVVRTLRWANSHSVDEITDVLAKAEEYANYKREVLRDAIAATLPSLDHEGLNTIEGYKLNLDVLATFNAEVAAAQLDLSRLFTNRFVEAATAQLGPDGK